VTGVSAVTPAHGDARERIAVWLWIFPAPAGPLQTLNETLPP
jgi:hypothetical protein